jgi:hypothetical protein
MFLPILNGWDSIKIVIENPVKSYYKKMDLNFVWLLTTCDCAVMNSWPFDLDWTVFLIETLHFIKSEYHFIIDRLVKIRRPVINDYTIVHSQWLHRIRIIRKHHKINMKFWWEDFYSSTFYMLTPCS